MRWCSILDGLSNMDTKITRQKIQTVADSALLKDITESNDRQSKDINIHNKNIKIYNKIVNILSV